MGDNVPIILKCEKPIRVKSRLNSHCSFAIGEKCYAHSYVIRSIIFLNPHDFSLQLISFQPK